MRTLLPSWTVIAWVVSATLLVLLVVDAGALLLTRMSTPDRAREAGMAAAQTVDGLALTQHTAVLGYEAARDAASDHALRVSADDFRVLQDGTIRLTVSRTAPTLLLQRLPRIREYVEVTATETVGAQPDWSAAR